MVLFSANHLHFSLLEFGGARNSERNQGLASSPRSVWVNWPIARLPSPHETSGRTLTPVEKQTLHYALEIFAFSAKAKKFLESKLHPKKGASAHEIAGERAGEPGRARPPL